MGRGETLASTAIACLLIGGYLGWKSVAQTSLDKAFMQNGFIVSQASKIAEQKETLATMQTKLDTASSEVAALTNQLQARKNEDLVSKYYENGQKQPALEILCKPIAEAYAEAYFDDNFADQAQQLCDDQTGRFEGEPPDPY